MSAKYGGQSVFSKSDEKSRSVLKELYRKNDIILLIPFDHASNNHTYSRQIVAGTMYHFKIPFNTTIHYIKVWHKLDNTYEVVESRYVNE